MEESWQRKRGEDLHMLKQRNPHVPIHKLPPDNTRATAQRSTLSVDASEFRPPSEKGTHHCRLVHTRRLWRRRS